MDFILEKWDEILMTVKTEHDITNVSFDNWLRPLEVYGIEQKLQFVFMSGDLGNRNL